MNTTTSSPATVGLDEHVQFWLYTVLIPAVSVPGLVACVLSSSCVRAGEPPVRPCELFPSPLPQSLTRIPLGSVFMRRRMRAHSFNCYLAGVWSAHAHLSRTRTALSAVDAALLAAALIIYPGISVCRTYELWCPEYFHAIYFVFPVSLLAQTGSVWTCVAVIVDRYLAVAYPFQARTYCSPGRAHVVLFGVAFFTVAYRLPAFFELEFVNNNGTDLLQLRDWAANETYLSVQNWLYALLMFAVPFASMLVLNVLVAWQARARVATRRVQFAAMTALPLQDVDGELFVCAPLSTLCTQQKADTLRSSVRNVQSRIATNRTPYTGRRRRGPLRRHIHPLSTTPCGRTCLAAPSIAAVWQYILVSTSNTLVCINSATNVLIYCMGKRFRRELAWAYAPCMAPPYRPDVQSTTGTHLAHVLSMLVPSPGVNSPKTEDDR